MKILRQGDINKVKSPKKFVCIYCGCKWIAKYGEYKPIASGLAHGYQCYCPCCGKVTSSIDTIE